MEGFAGYFNATLYKNVNISTLPTERGSENMISWFPMFFPLMNPFRVNQNKPFNVNITRYYTQQDADKLSYKWFVNSEVQ